MAGTSAINVEKKKKKKKSQIDWLLINKNFQLIYNNNNE